jgi:hypothetical protein
MLNKEGDMEDDDLLIDTPWGKKRWGMLREAMELYNKQQNEREHHESGQ